ncbi:MAG: response regulator [Exilibacterium sp.]
MEDKRALIVDDSRTACVVLSRVLKKYNIESDSCHSGMDALEYLKHSTPCVIFMDHNMPGMDGFEVVRKLKGSSLTASIPVMMYTGRSEEAFINEAKAAGVVDILSKQFNHQHVENALRQLSLWPTQYVDKQPKVTTVAANEPIGGMPEAQSVTGAASSKIEEQNVTEVASTEPGTQQPDWAAFESFVDDKISDFYQGTVKPYLAQSLFNGFAEQTEHRKAREKQIYEVLKENINSKHLEGLKIIEKLQRQLETNWKREVNPKFKRLNYIAAIMIFVFLGIGASQWYWWNKLDATEKFLQETKRALKDSKLKVEELQAKLGHRE